MTYGTPVKLAENADVKEVGMGVRNVKRSELLRLQEKTLDAQFLTTIEQGLNCSAFEANAVLDVVKEVYFSFLADSAMSKPRPGMTSLVAVSADEPAGKPIKKCAKRVVLLTVHHGMEDDRLLKNQGPESFRRKRIPELCQEALSQGALLTREDLAYRVFFTSPRTISRDLAAIRQQDSRIPLPLRSTVQDIGPVLTHRVEIVRLALSGKTMTEICRTMRHSPSAVSNYVSTFTRVAQLAERRISVPQMAFLLARSRSLINSYLELLSQAREDENSRYHLEQLLTFGKPPSVRTPKKRTKQGVR